MSPQATTYDRVAQLLEAGRDAVCLLLREDFADCGPAVEVDAALERMVGKGELAQLREDAFTYTELSPYTGQLTLRYSLDALAREYAELKGATVVPTEAQFEYAQGLTKQIPNNRFVGVNRPVEGQLQYGRQRVEFQYV